MSQIKQFGTPPPLPRPPPLKKQQHRATGMCPQVNRFLKLLVDGLVKHGPPLFDPTSQYVCCCPEGLPLCPCASPPPPALPLNKILMEWGNQRLRNDTSFLSPFWVHTHTHTHTPGLRFPPFAASSQRSGGGAEGQGPWAILSCPLSLSRVPVRAGDVRSGHTPSCAGCPWAVCPAACNAWGLGAVQTGRGVVRAPRASRAESTDRLGRRRRMPLRGRHINKPAFAPQLGRQHPPCTDPASRVVCHLLANPPDHPPRPLHSQQRPLHPRVRRVPCWDGGGLPPRVRRHDGGLRGPAHQRWALLRICRGREECGDAGRPDAHEHPNPGFGGLLVWGRASSFDGRRQRGNLLMVRPRAGGGGPGRRGGRVGAGPEMQNSCARASTPPQQQQQ